MQDTWSQHMRQDSGTGCGEYLGDAQYDIIESTQSNKLLPAFCGVVVSSDAHHKSCTMHSTVFNCVRNVYPIRIQA